MIIDIKIPSPGESVSEVQLAEWLVLDGDVVEKDVEIVLIDSDKASFAISAEESGQLKQLAKAGDTLKVGQIIAHIDTSIVHSPQSTVSSPQTKPKDSELSSHNHRISSVAKRMITELNLNADEIFSNIKKDKITKKDINEFIKSPNHQITKLPNHKITKLPNYQIREAVREKMSTLRLKLSQRLVAVKNETAMLTTFNEVNMSAILSFRDKYKEHQSKLPTPNSQIPTKLGMTSFFAKASAVALQEFPIVNAMIDGDEIVYYKFVDLGIAVSTTKGLIVPVIRNAHTMTLTEIELKIDELAEKTRNNRISLDEITGGTFTITNGGIFGSLLSTPILNPPQSAILGMHNIVERPIAMNSKVEIAPMMFVAMSYDHRLIDGKDSVSFLVRIKHLLENPFEKLITSDEFS